MTPRAAIAIALLCLPAVSLRADVFHLAGGGRIEGKLIKSEDIPATHYKVQTARGVVILARKQVEEIENASEAEREYQRLRVSMPATVEGHWEMAEFCRKNYLLDARAYHLGEIIKLEPDHADARHGLGYSRVKDEWVKTDEYNRAHGYVLDGLRWRTPQEIAIEKRNEEFTKAQGDWNKKLRMWRGWAGRKRGAEGLAAILAVDDWRAAKPIAEMLDRETNPQYKQHWIDVLGKLPTHDAWTALVKYSLEDNDPSIREQCIQKLEKSGTRAAVGVYLRALDDSDNQRVNRAALALARMQDMSTVPALIEHLVTTHKVQTAPSGGGSPIGASFSPGGGAGLSTGGPKVVDRDVYNEGVFQALNALTKQGFRNQDDWRKWYVDSHTPKGVNLRRSE